MKDFKPMLASPVDLDKLTYPRLVSVKLDGIRCIVKDGVAMTRSLKPIRNKFIQSKISHLEGLDGELVVGAPNARDVYRVSNSGIMSGDGEPDFKFYVFDNFNHSGGFFDRHNSLKDVKSDWVEVLDHVMVHDRERLDDMEAEAVDTGYEGLMLRDVHGPYKFGRSTTREGYLLKLKQWDDSEMVLSHMVERMHNTNEAKTNELGRTQRSTAKEGLVPMGTMGTLVGVDIHSGVTVEVGTGFSDELRAWFWERRHSIKEIPVVKYKCVKSTGVYDKPRHAVYVGFRDVTDIG